MDRNNLMGVGMGIIAPQYTLPPSTAPSFWTKLSDTFTKVQTTVKTATPVVQQGKGLFDMFKSTRADIMNPRITATNTQTPSATAPGMSKGFKVALGVAAAALVTGLVVKIAGKKKALGNVAEDVVSGDVNVSDPDLRGFKKSKKKKAKKAKK